MELIELKENEHAKWNEFLIKNNGHILQSFEYGELRETLNVIPLRFFIKNNDEITGLIYIQKIKFPFLPYSIFYSPRGPFFIDLKESYIKEFLESLRLVSKKHKAVF